VPGCGPRRPQPPVDLAPQLHQITARSRRRKPHMTLDVQVAVDRRHSRSSSDVSPALRARRLVMLSVMLP
jgi:hypothetical protein